MATVRSSQTTATVVPHGRPQLQKRIFKIKKFLHNFDGGNIFENVYLERRRGRQVKIIRTSLHAIVNRPCVGRRVGRGGGLGGECGRVLRPPQSTNSEVQPSGQHNDHFE